MQHDHPRARQQERGPGLDEVVYQAAVGVGVAAEVGLERLDKGEGFGNGAFGDFDFFGGGRLVLGGDAGTVGARGAVEEGLGDEEDDPKENEAGQGSAHPPDAGPTVFVSDIATSEAACNATCAQEDGVDCLGMIVSTAYVDEDVKRGNHHGPAAFVDEVHVADERGRHCVCRATSGTLKDSGGDEGAKRPGLRSPHRGKHQEKCRDDEHGAASHPV